jgi:hypothetical protein
MSDVQFQLARDSLQADYGEHRLHRLQRHGYQRWVHLKNQVNLYFFWERRC